MRYAGCTAVLEERRCAAARRATRIDCAASLQACDKLAANLFVLHTNTTISYNRHFCLSRPRGDSKMPLRVFLLTVGLWSQRGFAQGTMSPAGDWSCELPQYSE